MKPYSLNINGRLLEVDRPLVMGVVNATPDSFYAASRTPNDQEVRQRVRQMVAAGVDIIDVGAMSTRPPGHEEIDADEELERLARALPLVRSQAPDALISVDTFRAEVARVACDELGADMVNDISGGLFDPDMYATVAALNVPYILQHLWGDRDHYPTFDHPSDAVAAEVASDLMGLCRKAELQGVTDIIIDPGFGFGKNLEQNYELLARLDTLAILGKPILVGLSRKTMISRPLGITADEALSGTIAIDAFAIDRGAAIIRVHDVLPAVQTVKLWQMLQKYSR